MKHKRLRPTRRRIAPQPLLHRLPEGFYHQPDLQLRGGCLVADGCRSVLDFHPEQLCLDLGALIVTLYGRALRIESFVGQRVIVAGRIERLELQRRWGDADG